MNTSEPRDDVGLVARLVPLGRYITRLGDVIAIDAIGATSDRTATALLRKASLDAGQLVINAADGQAEFWFAGIGDPGRVFVEYFARRTFPSRDVSVAGVCSLGGARRILTAVEDGVDSRTVERLLWRSMDVFQRREVA